MRVFQLILVEPGFYPNSQGLGPDCKGISVPTSFWFQWNLSAYVLWSIQVGIYLNLCEPKSH